MDQSAISKIQETAAVNRSADMLKACDLPGLIVTTNEVGVTDLEKFMPNARHFRLNFKTNQITEFEGYVEENVNEDSKIFVDDESLSAKCIFDLGTLELPLHKHHTATVKLKTTAVYNAILRIVDQAHDQQTIAEFLEDWKAEVGEIKTTADSTMTVGQASSSVRNLTISQAREVNSQVDDFGYEASAMEKIEAKNKDKLPASIKFHINTHHGLAPRELNIRLSFLTSRDEPRIKLRIVGQEALQEEIAEEFKEILNGSLGEKTTVYIGNV